MSYESIDRIMDSSRTFLKHTYKVIDDKIDVNKHIHDCLAIAAAGSPLGAIYENVIGGMTDLESMVSRIVVLSTSLLGMGSVYTRLRDKFRRYKEVTDQTNEWKQGWVDFQYAAIFNGIFCPVIYGLIIQADLESTAKATAANIVLGVPTGYAIGWVTDVLRDAADIIPSQRSPSWLRKLPKRAKRTVAYAGAIVMMSLALGVYGLTPPKEKELVPQQEPLKQTVIPHQEWT